MSSLDHTPCKSGSPQGVRGALYSTALPLNAVTTSGGGVARTWPDTDAVLYTLNATITERMPSAAINRLVITVALSKLLRRFYSHEGSHAQRWT